MYGKLGTTAVAAGAPAGVLAYTGLPLLWLVVSAMTLIAAGFALLRLVPRAER
ncbi:hypothetical protein [Actinomycetospora straminea]|uniref:MFS transporter n=1 Tax=Actinomycetospora straminea TaxID=663607 RepID=A0ABP9ET27_9PSEU|nr:hypothetical protein [Actinomycetospora straminea]MDD7933900.1 hypothetical protein [Actinomycetospora straminea]